MTPRRLISVAYSILALSPGVLGKHHPRFHGKKATVPVPQGTLQITVISCGWFWPESLCDEATEQNC